MSVCRRAGAVVTCRIGGPSQAVGVQSSEDTNDAERLANDSRWTARCPERPAASTNTMSRFETEVEGLGRLNAKWVDGAMSLILDMVRRAQYMSYNGHFGSTAITLCVFNQFGCSVRGTARTGGVMYWIRSCLATGRQECGGTFVPMPHSLSRTSMNTWRSGTSFTL